MVLVGPELELRMTNPALTWSWERDRTRGVCPRLGVECPLLGEWFSASIRPLFPVVEDTWE